MSIREREQTTVRLPVDLKEEIQRQADEMGISFNAYVLNALNAVQNNQEKSRRVLLQTLRYVSI